MAAAFAGSRSSCERGGWRIADCMAWCRTNLSGRSALAIPLEQTLAVAGPLGILVGFASAGLSKLMYGFEDGFEHFCGRLRVHWMWWPAIGGIGIGLGGVFFPRGLGVGYDNIAELLRGNAPVGLLLGSAGRQIADVGVFAQFGNLGRRAGAAVDDWCGDGRISGSPGAYAGRNAGAVGVDGDGSDALGSIGRPAHGDPVFSGIDPRVYRRFYHSHLRASHRTL